MKNKKNIIITIIITVVATAAITSVSLYFILDNKNKSEAVESTSAISTTIEAETTEPTAPPETSEQTTLADAKLPARKDTPAAQQTTAQTVTTASTTVEQTTFESGLPVKHPDPQPPVYDYYIESNNIFHKVNCTIVKEYMSNGLYNELGDFTTVSYNAEQMQEQGYIPCEKCISQ